MAYKMNVCQAVQQLRTVSGLSQQAFATRFDMSVRAIANYEKDRKPNKQALFRFAQFADELNRPDLARVFSGELDMPMHFSTTPIIDDTLRSGIIAIAANKGEAYLRVLVARELARIIKQASKGAPLYYPQVFREDRSPDVDMQINYLEDLSKELRAETARGGYAK